MIKDFLTSQILTEFGHDPTDDQRHAAEQFSDFIFSPDESEVFLLRGYAGTGKTSLVSALVRTMEMLERPCVLLAPTGRAAKVLSLYSSHAAFTIHKRIYRQSSMELDAKFSLGFNGSRQTLFVVDEASMINVGQEGRNLLYDLVEYVYGNHYNCRLVLVGDTAQLPPVGEDESPALSPDTLGRLGLRVRQAELRQVVRQGEESGILWNATCLRQLIAERQMSAFPRIRFGGFADVRRVRGDELIDTLADCYHRYGLDDVMVVTRSNKRAVAYNCGIRLQILGREDELNTGEQLMVAKNNYFWLQRDRAAEATDEASPAGVAGDASATAAEDMAEGTRGKAAPATDFIANGDIAVLEYVHNIRELYGFRFADCTLRLPDYDDLETEATVLLDTLHAEAPALPRDRQDQLFAAVMEDYADIPTKRERLKKLREDPYYNALQVKYAYAVTCHKAQGGQWSCIFIDQGYMTEEMLGADYYRWLYTALTRSVEVVHFVNWSERQTEE